MLWFKNYNLEQINQRNANTMVENCGIMITEINENSLVGTMPVDHRNKQPFGILHGGANCVFAETLGSIAANLICDPITHHAVGLSITTNHLKAVRNGILKGVAMPVKVGRTTHVWDIKTYDESGNLTSSTDLTMMIVERLKEK